MEALMGAQTKAPSSPHFRRQMAHRSSKTTPLGFAKLHVFLAATFHCLVYLWYLRKYTVSNETPSCPLNSRNFASSERAQAQWSIVSTGSWFLLTEACPLHVVSTCRWHSGLEMLGCCCLIAWASSKRAGQPTEMQPQPCKRLVQPHDLLNIACVVWGSH